ncbi:MULTISPECIES: PEP-CTERM sorting domain-containing protein [unclassified Lentimonas]|uniref:PEP-CTERM sorting domain-containing protein n=1 Tax=unclassified Lentimonas TaxID=2630993 RepID=UPI001322F6F5|nr:MULTISPECIES: PEP-CTERM sorting domain-containing protein [unclassified Lentimonas]CAA6678637.1 Unannotated [Lentimonas sp. CC4]CAA6683623.1 Unannotated [Lentimonas sp. CC6]CAA7074531.1 Unannotated [Lentimonas sp. CC4]CAA7169147.1 Unannotated [Lentimonas sp. CC21]CAA7180452.1 Unannotated [Lentimonas sp. CC8]
MRKKDLITVVIAAVLCLPAQAAFDYQVVDPNEILADPLDKGFTVAGTITTTVGEFTENDTPFTDWNITVTLPGPSAYVFTPANSLWEYDIAGPNPGLVMIEVTESDILLKDISLPPILTGITTTLSLVSSSLDQRLDYVNLGGSSFFLQSSDFGGTVPNGSGYIGGSGDAIVAFQIPEPSSTALLLSTVVGLMVMRRRRL